MNPYKKVPVLFIGHGSPMNAIESNPFTESLKSVGSAIYSSSTEKPAAILAVSAHWLTRGTFAGTQEKPEIIYDFYGFPKELYEVKYPAAGAPFAAKEAMELSEEIQEDVTWGLDHGTWAVLKHMFPRADIPVFQLSIDYHRPMAYHFELARKLKKLREKGVLVIGSGNIVHNLRLAFSSENNKPYDWAVEFDEIVKDRIQERDFDSLVHYEKFGKAAQLSIPTVDHYVPLLYSLAMADDSEEIVFTYEEVFSSLSMRCLKIG